MFRKLFLPATTLGMIFFLSHTHKIVQFNGLDIASLSALDDSRMQSAMVTR